MHQSGCNHHMEHCVAAVPIFNHLSKEEMLEITALATPRSFKRGEFLYQPQIDADALYIVHTGIVKVYRLNDLGKEQLVRFLRQGDFTGELAIFHSSSYESYAEIMIDATICVLTKKALQQLLEKYPKIAWKIMEEFSRRLEVSERQTALVATEKVETRLALYLVELLDGDKKIVELPMSKKDIASYLGTTPETLSRKLTSLENQGYIEQLSNKKIKMNDVEGLLSLDK
ncbi:Crp/Fnr family transcriptional regulator [Gracilibacillus marinus]|uniref:Crp/Fnr family transcriptional regulator n=1 Tax=Gracilibacillus marinus TaxID=630535 RepID=A0ABV8VYC9_9BACI